MASNHWSARARERVGRRQALKIVGAGSAAAAFAVACGKGNDDKEKAQKRVGERRRPPEVAMLLMSSKTKGVNGTGGLSRGLFTQYTDSSEQTWWP